MCASLDRWHSFAKAQIKSRLFVVVLANGEQVKARRGHKTDWKDCVGLANLLRHDIVRPSFIPPLAMREHRV